jgi:hypothetical protein
MGVSKYCYGEIDHVWELGTSNLIYFLRAPDRLQWIFGPYPFQIPARFREFSARLGFDHDSLGEPEENIWE